MLDTLCGELILASDPDPTYLVGEEINGGLPLSVSPTRPFATVIAVIAFTLCGCASTLAAPTLAPVGVVHVPAAQIPADITYMAPKNIDAVRLDFTAGPELLANDDALILNHAFFCGDSSTEEALSRTDSPAFGAVSIRHGLPRRKARAAWQSGPAAHERPIYSVYVLVAQPFYPAQQWVPARPAYDLTREPRAICFYLTLDESYTPFRPTTNTLMFSAEQIGAALRAQ